MVEDLAGEGAGPVVIRGGSGGKGVIVDVELAEGGVGVAFDGRTGGVGQCGNVPVRVGKGVDRGGVRVAADKVVNVAKPPGIVGGRLVFYRLLYTLPITVVVKPARFARRGFQNAAVETIVAVFCDQIPCWCCNANQPVPGVVRQVQTLRFDSSGGGEAASDAEDAGIIRTDDTRFGIGDPCHVPRRVGAEGSVGTVQAHNLVCWIMDACYDHIFSNFNSQLSFLNIDIDTI